MASNAVVLVLVIVGFVGLIAFFIWLVWYLNKRRREAWMAAALELDMQYKREDPGLITRHGAFKLFGLGHSRRAQNVLTGAQRGAQLCLADYRYVVGHGKNQSVHFQTICILQSPRLRLPHFFLRRQRALLDFLGKLFGGQDINFDEDPAFSKAFVLQGKDEALVRGLFDAGLREFCLRFQGSGLQLEAQGDTFLFHEGRKGDPAKSRELVERAFELLTVLS
jgi:hypothetical protein